MKTYPRSLLSRWAGCLLLLLAGTNPGYCAAAPATPTRAESWVDALCGEPLAFDEMVADLQSARVTYLAEVHSIPRHHELQTQILQALASRDIKLVLAMEQFELTAQPALDQFNSGVLDLPGLVRQCDWDNRWPTHTNYHALLLAARQHGIPVLALNAPAETIRTIARHGLSALAAEKRAELPETIVTNDPVYERLLKRLLAVHMAFDPARLQPVFEAQVVRDETMAARLSTFLNSAAGQDRAALVICGRGHCEFGLGIPDRVARRNPGCSQRIILFSESGDLHLTPQQRQQSREVDISHQFLRELGRAPADYFHVIQNAGPGS